MTPPRYIVPGATYLITRRCIGGRFLLRPDKPMLQALLYCLAVAAERYGVRVHALCVMSSHYHLVATDKDAQLPLFTQYFHRLVTHCVQDLREWDDIVWEPGKRTSMVELLDEGAIVEKTLYTLCNPIKAGICRKEHQWPGCVFSGTHRFERPSCFKSLTMPEQAKLVFTAPDGFTRGEWQKTLQAQRADARSNAREQANQTRKAGATLIGVKAALRTSPTFRSRAKRAKGELNPCFASRCKETLLAAIDRMHDFYDAYRTASAECAQGIVTDFPDGTWKMKRLLGHC